jgi:hypothetical protein
MPFGSAPMVCTIARSAGKLATSPLRIAVETEFLSGATLRFNADPRLAAAAGGVARYFADAAGMDADAIAKLQADTLEACKAAFTQMSSNEAQLSVEVTRFADRIEVAFAPQGEASVRAGEPATRITKYLAQGSTTAS